MFLAFVPSGDMSRHLYPNFSTPTMQKTAITTYLDLASLPGGKKRHFVQHIASMEQMDHEGQMKRLHVMTIVWTCQLPSLPCDTYGGIKSKFKKKYGYHLVCVSCFQLCHRAVAFLLHSLTVSWRSLPLKWVKSVFRGHFMKHPLKMGQYTWL